MEHVDMVSRFSRHIIAAHRQGFQLGFVIEGELLGMPRERLVEFRATHAAMMARVDAWLEAGASIVVIDHATGRAAPVVVTGSVAKVWS